MLVVGAAPLPYGYYTLLRLVACAVFAYGAFVAFARSKKVLPWIFVFLAVLFNPIIKIHLPKEIWVVVDIAAAAFLVANARVLKHDA